jgi:polyferredoxin
MGALHFLFSSLFCSWVCVFSVLAHLELSVVLLHTEMPVMAMII